MPCNAAKSGLGPGEAATFLREPDYALSRHMTVEFYGCETAILADPRRVELIMLNAAKFSGATVVGSSFHSFAPQGVSGFVIIAESHFSVHAWPEHEYAAVDIFTCGVSIDFQKGLDFLCQGFHARHSSISSDMPRGLICHAGASTLGPASPDVMDCYTLSWKEKFERSASSGMLIALDLHQCSGPVLDKPARLRKMMRDLAARLGWTARGRSILNAVESSTLLSQACNEGVLSGRFNAADASAFMEIMSVRFCEPRIAAEAALSLLEAASYRMNVVLRR